MDRPRGRLAAAILAIGVTLSTVAFLGAGGCGEDRGGELKPVTLQLNWFHEAEFVGYYVAEAKGFYEREGLDVTILEGGPGTPARETVLNGASTFAITSFAEQRDMLVGGKPSVAVMAAFQIPPLVIFSLADSGIAEPAGLVGKKVGVTTSYWKNVLEQTLTAAGVDTTKVAEVDVKTDQMQLLFDGSVDAWLGYAQDEPIRAEMAGHAVKSIYPADFGIGGYEGLLITHQAMVDKSPELVQAFVKATYDGWRYAAEHADEAAQILTSWAPDNGLEFQKLAVRAVIPLVDVAQRPFGWIDDARWRQLMAGDYVAEHPGFTMQFAPVSP
jgi:NitT/TauT family transport system substrate-binding protein